MTSDLQERLITAARELLEEGGVPAVSVREAARRCGVSHGAPRRYFPSLELLLAAVAERCIEEVRDRVLDPGLSVADSARAYVDHAAKHPHAFDLFARHDVLGDSGWHLRSASIPLLVDWQAKFHGEVPGASSERATAVWAGIHGVASLASRRTLDVFEVAPKDVLEEMLTALGLNDRRSGGDRARVR